VAADRRDEEDDEDDEDDEDAEGEEKRRGNIPTTIGRTRRLM
jgi:hypothetical protein